MLDYGIFYEFIEKSDIGTENPKTMTLENVELGKNYAIVISTNAGLWRYVIGDTVVFTSLNPFRIKVTGRITQYINAFGEELIIENAERAFAVACTKTGATIKEYTGAPQFFKNKSAGKHQWLIEFEEEPKNVKLFTELFDTELKCLNSDYETKRIGSLVLEIPEIKLLKSGTFYNWMKNKKMLGGQHKIPRLSNNRMYVDELLKMI
jgi:hypothetical protein